MALMDADGGEFAVEEAGARSDRPPLEVLASRDSD
jgi:hypothetical protein